MVRRIIQVIKRMLFSCFTTRRGLEQKENHNLLLEREIMRSAFVEVQKAAWQLLRMLRLDR